MLKAVILALLLTGIVGSIYFIESGKPIKPESQEIPIDRSVKLDISEALGGGELALQVKPEGMASGMSVDEKAKQYKRAKELLLPDGYINTTKDFTIRNLVGKKVVMVDFWTYSCINCQRTIPYLNAWYEKYKDSGLEIVGVHTPEFEFEKKYENVVAAVKQYAIKYPVTQDNNFFTWREYENRYWPRKYLIDIDGFIVYDHIGEGAYDETEEMIQELLKERAERLGVQTQIATGMVKPADAVEVDASRVKSPEIYFGSARNQYLSNGAPRKKGPQNFTAPAQIDLNKLYLAGDWYFSDESAENMSAGAKIIFRYEAKDVYFVGSSTKGVKVKILKDGKALSDLERGADVSEGGYVTIKEEGLYKLIKGSGYGEYTLEMIVESPGLSAFTFTFG